MSDPSFLLPPKVAEPKAKKAPKEKPVVPVVKSSDTNTHSIKKYTQSKLKNDCDAVAKRIDKLTESIAKHDDILNVNKALLEQLQTKKQELEALKSQI